MELHTKRVQHVQKKHVEDPVWPPTLIFGGWVHKVPPGIEFSFAVYASKRRQGQPGTPSSRGGQEAEICGAAAACLRSSGHSFLRASITSCCRDWMSFVSRVRARARARVYFRTSNLPDIRVGIPHVEGRKMKRGFESVHCNDKSAHYFLR